MTGLKFPCMLLAVACCLIQIPAFAADVDSAARHTEYMVEMRWFAHWLKGDENGIMDAPRVAKNTIYYDADHSSASVLPVISQ